MKLKNLFWLFFTLALLAAPPGTSRNAFQPSRAWAAATGLSLEQILDRIEARYSGSGFAADFEQASTLKAMDITDHAVGRIMVKRPGKMRWEYDKPEKQVIITDGHKLWIYRPAENQVMVGSAPAFFRDAKGASFLSDIKILRRKFSIALTSGPEDIFYQLRLVPTDKSLDVSDVRLTVTQNTFTVIRVATDNIYGDETRIELFNIKFNPGLDDALFSFKIPPGADVVQMDQ